MTLATLASQLLDARNKGCATHSHRATALASFRWKAQLLGVPFMNHPEPDSYSDSGSLGSGYRALLLNLSGPTKNSRATPAFPTKGTVSRNHHHPLKPTSCKRRTITALSVQNRSSTKAMATRVGIRSVPISPPTSAILIAITMNVKMHVVIAYSLRLARPLGVSRLFNQDFIVCGSNIGWRTDASFGSRRLGTQGRRIEAVHRASSIR